jgi:arylsulfatase A-like enzyme
MQRRAVEVLVAVVHGAVIGLLAGSIAGAVEYVLLRDGFSGDLGRAYWKVLVPYAVLGVVAGLAVAAVVAVVRGVGGPAARGMASITAGVLGLLTWAYLSAWATFWLGTTRVSVVHAIAYLGAAIVGVLVGVAAYRVLARTASWLDARLAGTRMPLPVFGPTALAILAACVIGGPAAYLHGVSPVPSVTAGAVASDGRDRPNILLIVIDALRADHLPMYGYSRQTAPVLAALAREGLTFTQAYAQATYTRASVATLLTSLYPSVHKANDDRDYLSRSVPVLPEFLKAAGYTTYAISANANFSPTFGYSRGFDTFEVWKTESEFRVTMAGRLAVKALGSRLSRVLGESSEIVPTADSLTDATLQWARRAARKPFFAYVHYIDPHDPYRPPAPYDRAFDHTSDPPRRGNVAPLTLLPAGREPARVGRDLDLYDGEIRFADEHVGRLVAGLRSQGLLDNTLIVVTADHGEEFFEHGDESHGRSAYEEVARVPLIVAWPGRVPPGQRSEAMVGLIDLMPTFLDVAGVPGPAGIQGRSFAPLLGDPAASWAPRPLLVQVIQTTFALEAIRDGDHKFVRHTRGPRTGEEELYDLRADPLERTNLVAEARARAAGLRKSLDAFNDVLARFASHVPAEQAQKLDRDTERALRSLGYIK